VRARPQHPAARRAGERPPAARRGRRPCPYTPFPHPPPVPGPGPPPAGRGRRGPAGEYRTGQTMRPSAPDQHAPTRARP